MFKGIVNIQFFPILAMLERIGKIKTCKNGNSNKSKNASVIIIIHILLYNLNGDVLTLSLCILNQHIEFVGCVA